MREFERLRPPPAKLQKASRRHQFAEGRKAWLVFMGIIHRQDPSGGSHWAITLIYRRRPIFIAYPNCSTILRAAFFAQQQRFVRPPIR
jgi:hypothetical protein